MALNRTTQAVRDNIAKINRSSTIPLSQKRLFRELWEEVDSILAKIETLATVNYETNQLMEGNVVWLTGLTFSISDCKFVIDGEVYSSVGQEVTLSAADATNPRIDVFVAETDGTVGVVEGTPAATALEPEIDPNTQVKVGTATIAALATTPSGVTDVVIYDEDDDWTSSVTTNVSAADTSDPYAGTKAIKFTDAVDGNYVELETSTDVSPSEIDVLKLYVQNGQINSSGRNRLRLAFYKDTARVSGWVDLRDGSYGYSSSNLGSYQLVQIPIGAFNATGAGIDTLRIQFEGRNGVTHTYLIDDIKYQTGIENVDTTDFASLSRYNVWKSAQGGRVVQLTDGATITVDLSQGNIFEVTLDGNRTIDFTNATPGQHFTMIVRQDATTGSRTLTWDAANDWAGGTAPTLSTATSAVDVLSFMVDLAGNIHGSLGIADSQ